MKNMAFWFIAILITISTLVYQRMTGPTYPLKGTTTVGDTHLKYRLPRSATTGKDGEFTLRIPDQDISGYVLFRRHKSADEWAKRPLMRKENVLVATLPHQPPAGKLAYKVIVESQNEKISLSGSQPIIIRFKGAVPSAVLIPHIIIMFLALLLSTRAGLEALDRKRNPRKYALWATSFLLAGGLVFGPLVQKFAFGNLWTGFPLGFDLTDNKTLIAMIGWIAAIIAGRGGKPARGWVIGAAALMLVIFVIPHSLLGSELDYSQMNTSSVQSVGKDDFPIEEKRHVEE